MCIRDRHIISKAAQSARSLSIESGFLTDETNEQILQKAHGQAQSVSSKLPAEVTTDDAPAEKAE